MLYSFMSMLKKNLSGDWMYWVAAEPSNFRADSGIVSPMEIGLHLLTEQGIDPSECDNAAFYAQQTESRREFRATDADRVPYYVLNGASLGNTICEETFGLFRR